jgi:hypothetical protein
MAKLFFDRINKINRMGRANEEMEQKNAKGAKAGRFKMRILICGMGFRTRRGQNGQGRKGTESAWENGGGVFLTGLTGLTGWGEGEWGEVRGSGGALFVRFVWCLSRLKAVCAGGICGFDERKVVL